MKPLKIVHLTDYFIPPMGYQEYFLAQEHRRMGHRVTVVTSDRYFPFADYQNTVGKKFGARLRSQGNHREDGLSVVRLGVWFEHPRGGFIVLKGLEETLRSLKPDIVFADGIFSPVALQVALLKSKFDFKLIYDNHASDFNTDFQATLLSRIYLMFLRLVHAPLVKQSADKIVAIGTSEKELVSLLFSIPPNQIPIIYLGADTRVFKPNSKLRDKTRSKLGLMKHDCVLITAGKVNAHKDVDLIIKAIGKIKNPKLKLLIAGSGPEDYLNSLHQLTERLDLEKQIIFLGAYLKNEIIAIYNAADVGIWAGDLTNSIQEGMACGLPLILADKITKTQSSAHLLAENGAAFTRGNLSSLTNAISQVTKNRKNLSILSRNSLSLSRKFFSWKTIARQFIHQSR